MRTLQRRHPWGWLALILSFLPTVLGAQELPEAETRATALIKNSREGELTVTYLIPEGFHQVLSEEFFTAAILNPPGTVMGRPSYPAGTPYQGETAFYGETVLTIPFILSTDFQPGDSLTVQARYQLCSEEGTCYRPETINLTIIPNVTAQTAGGDATLLLYILLAFIGGIILNVMPCVLPVLSIKAMGIVRQGTSQRRAILRDALFYAAGIITSFLILAAVIIALKSGGKALGWGFQFQNIPFVLVLTLITWLFALSLFGVFEILPPKVAGEGTALARTKGGGAGSFLTGLLAVLLATPCTAPFLGTAMGFAFTRSPGVILILFLATGTGFALPFLLLGVWPKAYRLIPKPGPWMEVFKTLMGFVLAGTTLHLIHVLMTRMGEGIVTVLWFLLAAAGAAWIWGGGVRPDKPLKRRLVSAAIALTLLTGSAFFLFSGGIATEPSLRNEAKGTEAENRFSEQRLETLLADGKTVFVQFSAEWCLTCKTNERTVLDTGAVRRLFERQDVVVLKGDFTDEEPVLLEFLQKNGRAGVPFYQLYRPGREPVTFPEILTRGMLERALTD